MGGKSSQIAKEDEAAQCLRAGSLGPLLKDCMCIVLGFLGAPEQGMLRSTCRKTLSAFNYAVDMECYVLVAGSYNVVKNPDAARWFPVAERHAKHVDIDRAIVAFPAKCDRYRARYFSWGAKPEATCTLKIGSHHPVTESQDTLWTNELSPDWENVHFGRLRNLKSIDQGFLRDCKSLKVVAFQGSWELARIGGSFLENCPKVNELDLAPAKNLHAIEGAFAKHCDGLKCLVLQGLQHLSSIGVEFCSQCRNLVEVRLEQLPALTTIGDDFLRNGRSIIVMHVIDCPKLNQIGKRFAANCTSLSTLNLKDLPSMVSLDEGFCEGCRSLATVDVRCMVDVRSIGVRFCESAAALTTVFVPGNVELVGDRFLNKCSKVTLVSVEGTSTPAWINFAQSHASILKFHEVDRK